MAYCKSCLLGEKVDICNVQTLWMEVKGTEMMMKNMHTMYIYIVTSANFLTCKFPLLQYSDAESGLLI